MGKVRKSRSTMYRTRMQIMKTRFCH
ncbi:CLUMA_CG010630, isoform A [Clunio marinus]|uniref:CLUMA_CG010630, isoform A n=1 Tax=Clunio marinus TaxID=568069 RepID=A0A1J1IBW0_9DIPT|nr:CLUMA_CG010630, isoform A [Clunio marinus]